MFASTQLSIPVTVIAIGVLVNSSLVLVKSNTLANGLELTPLSKHKTGCFSSSAQLRPRSTEKAHSTLQIKVFSIFMTPPIATPLSYHRSHCIGHLTDISEQRNECLPAENFMFS